MQQVMEMPAWRRREPWLDAEREYEENRRQVEERQRERRERNQEDLRVRALRAKGLNDEADAVQRQIEREREYQRAVEDGWSAAELHLLSWVQMQEDAAAKVEAEWGRALSVFNAPSGFDIAFYSGLYGGPGRPGAPDDPYVPPAPYVPPTGGTGTIGGQGDSGILASGGGIHFHFHGGDPRQNAQEARRELEFMDVLSGSRR
jgi:hypothetical protein